MSHKIHALLVGINSYAGRVPPLEGCLNDVAAFESYLKARCQEEGAPEPTVEKLTNEQATRQAIIDGLRRLAQAVETAPPESEPVAVFYYSGHGSQEYAPEEFWAVEPDHMNETLVCYDSRDEQRPGNHDLADKELGALLKQVSEKASHTLVVLDCCHSGSGTRQVTRLRQAPKDTRPRSLSSLIPEARTVVSAVQKTRDVAAPRSTWPNLQQGRHVLLAACRDVQTAKEIYAEGQARGAFTYYLLQALTSDDGLLTYRELTKMVQARLAANVREQMPQLEGLADDFDQPFLGGVIQPRPRHFSVQWGGSDWQLDAGQMHGLPANLGEPARLAVFSPHAENLADIQAALGYVDAVDVRAAESVVSPVEGLSLKEGVLYKAVVASLPMPPVGVLLDGEPEALALLRKMMDSSGPGATPSLYVQETNMAAQLRVGAEKDRLVISFATDLTPLADPLVGWTEANARRCVQRLEHIARWMRTIELHNPLSNIPSDALKLELKLGEQTLELQAPMLPYRKDERGAWVQPSFSLTLTNTTFGTFYCAVLDLSESFAIDFISRENPLITLGPLETTALHGESFIPADLFRQGLRERRDVLKVIVCTAPFDPALLTQERLDGTRRSAEKRSTVPPTPLSRLMRRVARRELGDQGGAPATLSDWATTQVTLTTVLPEAPQQASSLEPPVWGMRLEGAPEGLRCARSAFGIYQNLKVAEVEQDEWLVLRAIEGVYELLRSDGKPLITPLAGYSEFNGQRVVRMAHFIARYYGLMALHNPTSALKRDAVAVEVAAGGQTQPIECARLAEQPRAGQWLPVNFSLRLTQRGLQPLYAALMLPNETLYKIDLLPFSGLMTLPPGQPVEQPGRTEFPAALYTQGQRQFVQRWRLVVATQPFPVLFFMQQALERAVDVSRGRPDMGLAPQAPPEWNIFDLALTICRD